MSVNPDAEDLISQLLGPKLDERYISVMIFHACGCFVKSLEHKFIEEFILLIVRPEATEVLLHPLFWKLEKGKKKEFIDELNEKLKVSTGFCFVMKIRNIRMVIFIIINCQFFITEEFNPMIFSFHHKVIFSIIKPTLLFRVKLMCYVISIIDKGEHSFYIISR